MQAVLYHNICKGALGEIAGRFILENERGIVLSPIDDPNCFEFFDYILAPGVYIDFKNRKFSCVQDKEKTRARILKKAGRNRRKESIYHQHDRYPRKRTLYISRRTYHRDTASDRRKR